MAKRNLAGLRGIVTGASSGIGRAIAQSLAAEGAKVLAIARRADRLATLSGGEIIPLAGDITDANFRATAIQTAQHSLGGLDFLVNAAGISSVSRFADSTPERLREILEVNFLATAEMIRTALPALQQGNTPIIVNIGSILGHRGIPFHADYCASKFAVQGLSESIRPELAKLGIDLLIVSPGTTKTELYATDSGRAKLPWPEPPGVTAEYVAHATVRAMQTGRAEIIPNPRGKMLVWLSRLSPALLNRVMKRYG